MELAVIVLAFALVLKLHDLVLDDVLDTSRENVREIEPVSDSEGVGLNVDVTEGSSLNVGV